MKKLYTILACSFLLFQGKSFSQSANFTFLTPDTIEYGDTATGGELTCANDWIINKTANSLTLHIRRIQDVNLATGWESYLCTGQQCYIPTVDSINLILPANDSIEFIPHFGITATPDSQTILMSVRNAANASDVVHQRFHGVTKKGYGLGMNEHANLAMVNIYPSPVMSGNELNLNISNVRSENKNFSLVVYTIYGTAARTVTGLHEGNNTLNLGMATGIYSYRLVSGDTIINAGNFSVIR